MRGSVWWMLGMLLLATPALAQPPATTWVASWAQAMTSNFTRVRDAAGKVEMDAAHHPVERAPTLHDATLRQVVHLSLGGDEIRIRLSNYFGEEPLTVSAARIALPVRPRAWSFTVDPGSARALTFAGKPSVTIAPGATATSDPVRLPVPPLANLVVGLYFAGTVHLADVHPLEHAQTAIAANGNALDAASLAGPDPLDKLGAYANEHVYILDEVDAVVPATTRGIVAFGDSITDGAYATAADRIWPARLSALANGGQGTPAGVVNAAISGNELLVDQRGEPDNGVSGLKRFERDVVDRAGVTDVVVLMGANDLDRGTDAAGYPTGASFGAMIAGFRMLIDVAHAHHLRIYGGTITPVAGFPNPGWYSPAKEIIRRRINHWIRTSGAFDGVVDFSRGIAGAYKPSPLAATQHPLPPGIASVCAGDAGLHPNDRGYVVMGTLAYNAVFDAKVQPAETCH